MLLRARAAQRTAAFDALAARAAVRPRLVHRRERARLQQEHGHRGGTRHADHARQPGQQLLQEHRSGANGPRGGGVRESGLLQQGRPGLLSRRALLRARIDGERRRCLRSQHGGPDRRARRHHPVARRVHRRGARGLRLPRHVPRRLPVLRHHAAVHPCGHLVPVPHVRRLPRVGARRPGRVRRRAGLPPRVPGRWQLARGRHARVLHARDASGRAALRATRRVPAARAAARAHRYQLPRRGQWPLDGHDRVWLDGQQDHLLPRL